MKIKLSKAQWEGIGKKAGWIKSAQPDFDHRDPKNYAPGQTPYTDEEWSKVRKMIGDAANAEAGIPIEELGDDTVSRRRHIKVTMSDGDVINTEINGTKKEIEDYYLKNNFVKQDEKTMHHGVKVEFLK